MRTVQFREAKVGLSALIEAATITRFGKAVAVLVPVEVARHLYPSEPGSFADVLMSFPGGVEFDRDQMPMRSIDL